MVKFSIERYSKINVNGECVQKIDQLENIKDIKIQYIGQIDQNTLLLTRELYNVNTIKSVKFEMDYIDKDEEDGILKSLQIVVGQQISLQDLQASFFKSNLNTQSCLYLINFFKPNLTSLDLTIDELKENQLYEISKGLNCIKNLLKFIFEVKFYNEQELKYLYEVIQKWKELKSLTLATENKCSEQQQNLLISQDLAGCENLRIMINDLSLFSTFQKAQKLKTLSLIIKKSTKNQYKNFVNASLPNLQMLNNISLQLLIYSYDDLSQVYQKLIFEKLKNLVKLSIHFCLEQDYFREPISAIYIRSQQPADKTVKVDFGSTFSFLQKNNKITSFQFMMISKNLLVFNKISDIQNLKNIQHLELFLQFFSAKDEEKFFKSICQLQNILSIDINNRNIFFSKHQQLQKIKYKQQILKLSRLVQSKIRM